MLSKNTIQHNHMLIRMETIKFPDKNNILKLKNLIKKIISEIDMKLLGEPIVHYVDKPIDNRGITAICSIATSHLSFHIWETPALGILQNKKSKALLQIDIYTCGSLSKNDAKIVLENFNIYDPTRINIDILDRKKDLKLKYHTKWNDNGKLSYQDWINKKF